MFVNLVFGLQAYLDSWALAIPNSLRRALNSLAYARPNEFPKTLSQFIALCHHPVSSWYPLLTPDDFNPSHSILYDRRLSEEAQDWYLTLTEKMQFPLFLHEDVPQTALDNLKMSDLRQRLRENPDRQTAQALYVQVRSFLIEHSWTTHDQLREQPLAAHRELREFYEEIPSLPLNELIVCERCGLLEWREGDWQGIKPGFCSDHGSGSPYIHSIPASPDLYRLKRGIHLRTFLPGRLELALFTLAEDAQAAFPNYLLAVERYPGLDTYDLRLTFSDGEIWAVDAKDHPQPERLASQLQPLYGEGDLAYTHAFYVIPDAHMDDANYREHLERAAGALPTNLSITSVSTFQQRMEEKLKRLATPLRQKKGKRPNKNVRPTKIVPCTHTRPDSCRVERAHPPARQY